MTKQELINSISDSIYSNGSGSITGDLLKDKLLEIINNCYNTNGGGGQIPKDLVMVTESRDFQASDAGKILILYDDANLTMPSGSILQDGDLILLGVSNSEISIIEKAPGDTVNLYSTNDGSGNQELLLLEAFNVEGQTILLPISTSIIDDNGVNKTALRYLMDKVDDSGGGQIAFTKTKAEIDTLIAGGNLVAGALYEITGVHPTLYDDGNTSGTTVYLRAISGSELEVQGMGKFYNPKYNQAVDGFGIWDNKMYGTLTSIVGQFDYINKEGVTANNGATGLMLAQGMIQWVSGDWSAATSITGDVSSATANISGFVSPSYSIGDKVIWGGYSWTNVNGNVGASVDVLNLDAEWTKNVYDTTNYNVAYDLIEYDYANDMIIRRFEKESNVDVKCSKAQYDYFVGNNGFTYHSISVQQFGNALNTSSYKGQLNILCENGYNESINFSGVRQGYLTFGIGAHQSNLTFGTNASQVYITFGSGASQSNLTFGTNVSQDNLTFGIGAYQSNLTFGTNVSQDNLTFGIGAYQSNLTFGTNASQSGLTFGSSASQTNLTFGSDAYQTNLTFESSSGQDNLIFGSDAYQTNLTFGSGVFQHDLTFGRFVYQQGLTFESGAGQYNLTFESGAGQLSLKFAEGTQLNYNNQTINSNMEYVSFRTKLVTVPDLSSATYIFDGNIKEVYQRPDGALKLKFYDNSDALQIVDIED